MENTSKTNETQVYLVLFLVATLGGAIRKWFTASGALSNAILGIQMVLPFLFFALRGVNAISPFSKNRALFLYFFYLFVHIFYPLQLSLIHGLFGLLIHGGFWLGTFYYLSNREQFNPSAWMKVFMAIALLEIILGFIQYALPSDHFLNKYAREGQSIAMVGSAVRITGTFSYLSGYTAYLLFYVPMVWAMIRLKYPQWLVSLALIFGLVASFMTGSRSATLIYLVMAIPVVVKEYPIKDLFKVAGRFILPLVLSFMVILLSGKVTLFDKIALAYNNFMIRVEGGQNSGEQSKRFTTDLWYIQNANYRYPILGVGLGATYQGANQLLGTSWYVTEFGYVESELARVLLEGGWTVVLMKLLLGYLLAINLSFKGVSRWSFWFVYAFGQPIVFNPHNSAFLLMGIILVDNIIWRQNNQKWVELDKSSTESEEETPPTQVKLPGYPQVCDPVS